MPQMAKTDLKLSTMVKTQNQTNKEIREPTKRNEYKGEGGIY